jgi:cysteine desulfurase
MRRIYLDANATTPVLPEVLEAMRPWFLESFGNASSIHQPGQRARAAVEQAREYAAQLVGCRPGEIVFTAGGTESDNAALFGALKPGDHLITTTIEHHAVLHTAEKLRDRGMEVTFLPVSADGVVDPDEVRRAFRPNTRLVSIMYANNETGAIQPIAEIGRLTREAGILLHTDAVQAAGKLPIDVKDLNVDLLSISGHKMHAPQGTGLLYIRRGLQLEPMLFGGSHERQRRAGTENVPGIVGFGKAAELAMASLASGAIEKMAALRDRLEQGVLAAVEGAGAHSTRVPRTANTTSLYFDQLEGEALVISLDLRGLAVSGGSACMSGATDPSHVLLAMGVPGPRARATIRCSLSKLNTAEDIEAALEVIPACVARLRELSPANAGTLG